MCKTALFLLAFVGMCQQSYAIISDSVNIAKTCCKDAQLTNGIILGAPLVTTGLLIKGEDRHFQNLRNSYMKEFRHSYDNYIQYLPGIVMIGMKSAGIESRDSWGRMLASDVMSALIMGSLVETSKLTTNVTRPDGSNDHSFPSGHTATSFMTATMLTKEYGHISPWIGIGAYTVATATGFTRIFNNKHWVSDVITGAGIGIISTEFGYFIADCLFKGRGINHLDDDCDYSRTDNPSFFSICIGANIPLSYYAIDDRHELRTSSGCIGSLEGALFFSPYFGCGGNFKVSSTHIITNNTYAEDDASNIYAVTAGPYVSYPITSRFLIGGKLTAGYIHYSKLTLNDGTFIPHKSGLCAGTGISFTYRAQEHYNIKLMIDYNLQPPYSKNSGEWINVMSIGTAFGINI